VDVFTSDVGEVVTANGGEVGAEGAAADLVTGAFGEFGRRSNGTRSIGSCRSAGCGLRALGASAGDQWVADGG